MTTIYTLPKLKSLRQGARIAFIRQYRQMTQKALGIKVGMTPVSVGRMMNKIEVHDRDISPDRLKKMAEVLDVNIHMIERWDFKDPEQLFYALLWIDELCPNIVVRNTLKGKLNNETMKVLNKRYAEWRDMRRKYLHKYITYPKYLDWKLGKYEDSFKEDANEKSND